MIGLFVYACAALKNRWKVAFLKALVVTGALIWHSLFRVAATLDFAQTGYRKSSSVCLRWFLKSLRPYLTPCQITKHSHQAHDHPEFPLRVPANDFHAFYIVSTFASSCVIIPARSSYCLSPVSAFTILALGRWDREVREARERGLGGGGCTLMLPVKWVNKYHQRT